MKLVRIIKNWDWPDLMRQTPGGQGVWDGIQFTVDPVDECDFLIVLNNAMKWGTSVQCAEGNVWAIMQEPYMKGFTDWMVEKHEHFCKIFTHYMPSNDGKYITSHPAIPWHVKRTFDELISSPIPSKTQKVSWIVGDAKDLPGHIKRWSLLECMQGNNARDIHLYGKAVRFIEDKGDGLAPYKFSLAIENTSGADYWTEKVSDCFLTWTVPIYYGCTNLEKYFPEESFIRIDIGNPGLCVERIRRIIDEESWEERLPALEQARKLVLYRYQLFPHLSELIRLYGNEDRDRTSVTIPAYKRSKRAFFCRIVYNFKKKMGLL